MKRTILIIGVIVFITLACNFNMGKSNGGEVNMDESGFSANIPEGYEMSSIFGELSCIKDGAEYREGPNYSISVSKPDPVYTTPETILDNLAGSNNIFNYKYSGNRTPITVSGIPALAEDFTGVVEETGVAIAGRAVTAILPDGRQLRCIGNWPVDQQKDSESVFNALLDSLKFFDPVLSTVTP